jgi:general secretion pathway protein B
MSFILDALKKSETERQRQSGPALFEVRVAPPAARFPVWAVALGALLGINVVVFVAWVMLRDGGAARTAASAPAAAVAAQSAAAPAPAAPPPGTGPAPAYVPGYAPPGIAAAPPPAAGAPPPSAFNPPLVEDPAMTAGEVPASATYSPSDYQPALPAGSPRAAPTLGTAALPPAAAPQISRAPNTRTGVPSRDDLVAAGATDLPAVAMSLHVYDASPTRRFAIINGRRAGEGETLQDGLRLEEISADGAVLSWRGSRFLVTLQ